MTVVIILPTYNERENVRKLIPTIQKLMPLLNRNYQVRILVVDDDSPDETKEVVKKQMEKWNNVYLLSGKRKGLGAAYVRGMKYAKEKLAADILFEMDADFSHDPKLIPSFLAEIEKGNDFVIGSRYINGGSIPQNWAFHRKLFSISGNLIVRFGLVSLPIHDWTSGYRAMKVEVFDKVGYSLSRRYPGYTFQVALLHRVRQAGFRISEIPLQFVDRNWGQSKIIPPEYIYNVLLYVFTHSTFTRYLVVGGSGFLLQTLLSHVLIELGVFPGLAVGVGAEAAIISNFTFNNLWTFSHKRLHGKRNLATKFSAFQATSIGAVLIQSITVSIVTLTLGKSVWFWAMVFAIVFLVVPYNFFIYNRFIWKTHQKSEKEALFPTV